jgi:hypothetical protein
MARDGQEIADRIVGVHGVVAVWRRDTYETPEAVVFVVNGLREGVGGARQDKRPGEQHDPSPAVLGSFNRLLKKPAT